VLQVSVNKIQQNRTIFFFLCFYINNIIFFY